MKVEAIIFDKDGTLLDFDAFWVAVSHKAIAEILAKLGTSCVSVEDVLEAFGVHDGVADVDGILCKGTYAQMGECICELLRDHGCSVSEADAISLVNEAYKNHSHDGEIIPTCDGLYELLSGLKEQGIKLAVVTTDITDVALECLERLKIRHLFDKIYTDDGRTPTKPDPYCAEAFSHISGIDKANMLMVGDTMTDVQFAKNAGMMSAALARSEKVKSELAPHADFIIESLSDVTYIVNGK